jgi:uncharacterized protein YajQ (UPF0234 family)
MKLDLEINITIKNTGDVNQLKITVNENEKLNYVLVALEMAERELQSKMMDAFKITNQDAQEWFENVTLKEIYN